MVDQRIWASFKHACKNSFFHFRLGSEEITNPFLDRVPADFKAFAEVKDRVDPKSKTYSNPKNIGTLKNFMRQKPSPGLELVDIDEPEGCIFEADKGVPVLILVTKLQSEELQVSLYLSVSNFYNQSNHCSRRRSLWQVVNSPGPTPSIDRGQNVMISANLRGLNSSLARLITVSGGPLVNWYVKLIIIPAALYLTKGQAKRAFLSRDVIAGQSGPRSDQDDDTRQHAWKKLFDTMNEALHLGNLIIERLNPDLTKQYYQLSQVLNADKKKNGEFLGFNECFLPGVAVHFNMAPEEDQFHYDGMSLFLGWESVSTLSN